MTDQMFMNIIAGGLILAGIVFLLKHFLKDFPFLLPAHEKYRYKEIAIRSIKSKDIRKRGLITISLLLFYRLATFIPIPGIDIWGLHKFLKSLVAATGGSALYILGDSALSKLSIFALGVMPYISACLLIQIFSLGIPKLRKLYEMEGEARKHLLRFSYLITIALCLIQSYFLGLWLANPAHFKGISIVTIDIGLFRIFTILTLTGSTIFSLWLADLITKYGIGNGIAMIIFSNLVVRLVSAGQQLKLLFHGKQIDGITIILFVVLVCLYAWGTFYLTTLFRKQDVIIRPKQKTCLPLRPSAAGTLPIALAALIYTFPLIFVGLKTTGPLAAYRDFVFNGAWFMLVIQGALILIFSYCYVSLLLSSTPLTGMLQRYGYLAEDKNKDLESDLKKHISIIAIISGCFLIFVAIIPNLIGKIVSLPYHITALFNSSSLIIGIGVVYDLLRQIEAKLIIADSGGTWDVAYSALDEIEANIKKTHLENNNIEAVIEPLRFTWGLPIKTAVDEYRIYVEKDNVFKAKELLK